MKIQYKSKQPKTGKADFIAQNATLVGDVRLKEATLIFFNSVLRGEETPVIIGERSAVLENTFIEGSHVGKSSLISHGATLHFAKVNDGALIGIGAILLEDCVVKSGAVIGAGAVVLPGTKVPSNSLFVGQPAKEVRKINGKEKSREALQEVRNKSKHYKKVNHGSR